MAHDLTQTFAQLKTEDGLLADRSLAGGHGRESSLTAALQRHDGRPSPPPTAAKIGGTEVPAVVAEEWPASAEPADPREEGDDDGTYAPTQAIYVPGWVPTGPAVVGEYAEDGYFAQSSLSKYMSQRSSISFDPTVTTDDGVQQALEAPLPKPAINTPGRGRSLLEEMQKREMQRQLSRARSETDREDYDPDTGERLQEDEDLRSLRDVRWVAGQPRWPFLQETVNDLAHQRDRDRAPGRNHSASLTSRTTASPALEEIRTPDSARAAGMVPPLAMMASPPPTDWDGPSSEELPRQLSAASRSKSFGLERRASRRMGSRRLTSNSLSPASVFLSKYFPSSPPTAQDGEGQEVGDYVLGREIGFGGFSVIREAATISNGQRLSQAVKIVRRQVEGKAEVENEKLQAEYDHEIALWRCLSHEHILPLFAVWETDFATFAFTHLNTGGTLFDAVRNSRGGVRPALARRYAYQVASALRYLHEDMHIVHRDVKLENCLVDVSDPKLAAVGGKILLCDFGLADYMGSDDGAPSKGAAPSLPQGSAGDASALAHLMGPADTSTNIAGSLPYASPEMMHSQGPLLTPTSDLWAFGVVCYALVVGRLPFQHAFAPRVRMMILGSDYDGEALRTREFGGGSGGDDSNGACDASDPAAGSNGSGDSGGAAAEACLAGCGELVRSCLQRNLKKRWDVRACLDSQWLLPERDEAEERGGWA